MDKALSQQSSTLLFIFIHFTQISENHEGLRKVILTVLRQDAAKPQCKLLQNIIFCLFIKNKLGICRRVY